MIIRTSSDDFKKMLSNVKFYKQKFKEAFLKSTIQIKNQAKRPLHSHGSLLKYNLYVNWFFCNCMLWTPQNQYKKQATCWKVDEI